MYLDARVKIMIAIVIVIITVKVLITCSIIIIIMIIIIMIMIMIIIAGRRRRAVAKDLGKLHIVAADLGSGSTIARIFRCPLLRAPLIISFNILIQPDSYKHVAE